MLYVLVGKPSIAQSIAKIIGAIFRRHGCIEGNYGIASWYSSHLAGLADVNFRVYVD